MYYFSAATDSVPLPNVNPSPKPKQKFLPPSWIKFKSNIESMGHHYDVGSGSSISSSHSRFSKETKTRNPHSVHVHLIPFSPSDFSIDSDSLISSRSDSKTVTAKKFHVHFGDNFSGHSFELNNIHSMMSDLKDMTALKTTSNGTRKAFIVGGNNTLNIVTLKKDLLWAIIVPLPQSTQLCRFQQCSRGSIVAFSLYSSKVWRLGIVKSIFPMNDPPIAIFEWTRGYPVLVFQNL